LRVRHGDGEKTWKDGTPTGWLILLLGGDTDEGVSAQHSLLYNISHYSCTRCQVSYALLDYNNVF